MLAFAAVCLACGLYYFADLAEEYTQITKTVIRYTIFTEIVIHFLLLIIERFPILPSLIGISAHAMYYLLLLSFPFVAISSPQFIAACILFVASLVSWFLFFSGNHDLFYSNNITPGYSVAFFYVSMVFLVPTALFVGLTVNDSQLPGMTEASSSGARGPRRSKSDDSMEIPGLNKKKRRNLISSAVASIGYYAKQLYERVRGRRRNRTSDFF